MEWTSPDTWLVLYETDSTCTHVDVHDMDHIDAAVTAYLDSAETRDTLLHLTMVEGGVYVIRASHIKAWFICSPEHRHRGTEHEKYRTEENKRLRLEVGLPWDGD